MNIFQLSELSLDFHDEILVFGLEQSIWYSRRGLQEVQIDKYHNKTVQKWDSMKCSSSLICTLMLV